VQQRGATAMDVGSSISNMRFPVPRFPCLLWRQALRVHHNGHFDHCLSLTSLYYLSFRNQETQRLQNKARELSLNCNVCQNTLRSSGYYLAPSQGTPLVLTQNFNSSQYGFTKPAGTRLCQVCCWVLSQSCVVLCCVLS